MREVKINFPARAYQQELINWYRNGGKKAFEVWHRRAGKDRTATFIESELSFKRVGLYWHALPEYRHARRVIWDNITRDGQKLVDINFPPEIIKRRSDQDMKIELINGSIWQLVGADNFDSLVGSNPIHVTFSEYALMGPKVREFIRPILAENGGTELYITTPRGYNHAHDLWQEAKSNLAWHAKLLTVHDTNVIPFDILAEERRTMPDELYRQEYECDFSAANIGAILGRYVEMAEKEGRINNNVEYDKEFGVEITSDIGFRDTSTWWYWQPRPDGFALIDYDEDSGLDASEWTDRLRTKPYRINKIWLPHDAKARTFATRHSAVEQFLQVFGHEKIGIVPLTKKQDSINAARTVIKNCWFHRSNCAQGLAGLREWSFEYDEDKKTYSKEPKHDWASHPGDGFSYGALIMQERVIEKKRELPIRGIAVNNPCAITLDEMWKETPKKRERI